MKIAIISDTHDNIPNIKKALSIIESEGIKSILHCGDITSQEAIENGLKPFKGNIYLVFGNADKGHFPEKEDRAMIEEENLKYCGNVGEITLNSKKIGFTHFPEKAKDLALSEKYDLVFYGHTHKPWEETVGKTRVVNPGNVAGTFYRATFAIFDTVTSKLELKIL